ncbi:MAG: response regulator receiver protein [Bacteroidetes bacterium]|jgi:ActR/RegA family two-component response regulator|nr:response regulator receiver protein [Bacteroidota bacterium]
MRLLLFENEFHLLKTCFDALKVLHFPDLSYEVLIKSQDLSDFKRADDYDYIFVDINLTDNSNLDGFQIIQKLLEEGVLPNKICVLTGWVNIQRELENRGLSHICSISKPIKIETLYNTLKHLQ